MNLVTRATAWTSLVLLVGCLELRGEDSASGGEYETRCATCHGDPDREGDSLLRAAPPIDLNRNTDRSYPGVGAHQIHLVASETHPAIACSECHVVPNEADAPGHADDARPAELRFGSLSRTGARSPRYDPVAQSCADTWCHRSADAVWTLPKSSSQACGTCHALPPPAPHPQGENCAACHGEVISQEGTFARPDQHVDGTVQYDAPACQACHGDEDSPAPPSDTAGNSTTSFVGVGAHRAHLSGSDRARAVECAECHVVPDLIQDPTHVDGAPAEIRFSGVTRAGMRRPSWDREARRCTDSWCHGPGASGSGTSPDWVSDGPLLCDSCHGAPPPDPHPQMARCSLCHQAVIDETGAIRAPELHVDGVVQTTVPMTCTGCHGDDDDPAPPKDVSGNRSSSFAGVGAHKTHVAGTVTSRAVPCEECHIVPSAVFQEGHVDTLLPAELSFSGVATAHGASVVYEEGSCNGSYCHGAAFSFGRPSGGSNTAPKWSEGSGSEAACGSCHGLPPPPGHPQYIDCQYCHRNVKPDNRSFFDPTLHVNGITENYIP